MNPLDFNFYIGLGITAILAMIAVAVHLDVKSTRKIPNSGLPDFKNPPPPPAERDWETIMKSRRRHEREYVGVREEGITTRVNPSPEDQLRREVKAKYGFDLPKGANLDWKHMQYPEGIKEINDAIRQMPKAEVDAIRDFVPGTVQEGEVKPTTEYDYEFPRMVKGEPLKIVNPMFAGGIVYPETEGIRFGMDFGKEDKTAYNFQYKLKDEEEAIRLGELQHLSNVIWKVKGFVDKRGDFFVPEEFVIRFPYPKHLKKKIAQ